MRSRNVPGTVPPLEILLLRDLCVMSRAPGLLGNLFERNRGAYLALDAMPHVIRELRELRTPFHIQRSRPFDLDWQDLANSPRPRGQHHDAIGKEDRLVDLVRDKDHRVARLTPDPQELILHDLT